MIPTASKPSRCFQKIAEGSEFTTRLVCFPFAGDALPVSAFRRWQRHLRHETALWVARYPGRAERMNDPHPEAVSDLVSELADAFGHESTVPTIFLGHSMGALVAFELARRLRDTVHAPASVIVSAFFAPQSLVRERDEYGQDDDEILRRLEALGGTPAEILRNEELRELLLPTIRADFNACDRYIYRPAAPLNCPLTAMGGYRDPLVNQRDIASWQDQTENAFRMKMFPGGHFYLFSEEAESLVLWTLAQELKHVRAELAPIGG
ncbi:MAG TPA: alpha/beta fold hydrolase [Candidatus Competibacter sp.]|nr:alpha/beta fold hydrolase [Candidatus Competibacter sp.]